MFLLFYHAYKQLKTHTHTNTATHIAHPSACRYTFSSPKPFLWTLSCAHWCFFLSLHEWWVGIHIYSVTTFSTVIIAPLSNLWPAGVLVPPNTHRIPSNHPSLICKIDWLFPEAAVESDKSNQGKLLFVSSDQSIYGGIVWCCSSCEPVWPSGKALGW